MRVGVAQLNPRIGDLEANTRKIVRFIEDAKAASVALLVFPELAVTGYPPRDLLDYDAFLDAIPPRLAEIAAATTGSKITVIVGFVERVTERTGRRCANAAAVVSGGRIALVYRKRLLPCYDVFEEERYFAPGQRPGIVSVAGKRVAVTVCEDLWDDPRFLDRPYDSPIREELQRERPDLVVNLSASPFHLGKPEQRLSLFSGVATSTGATVVFANQVGGNDELLFDGCSFVVAADGRVLARGPAFVEKLVVVETAGAPDGAVETWPAEETEWLRRALATGLRDYVFKCGASRVCLGLSGGVDSSVVAAIAVDALGPDAVAGLALPTRFNQAASLEDAQALAKNLGIALTTIPMEPLFGATLAAWRTGFPTEPSALTTENIQPRLRMTLLMAFANETQRILLNTSNKSEISCGYATLYGDAAGGVAVLGDLVKRQIYALARHYNVQRELIPKRVIERAPSAELRENQTDQDSLPPYDLLDPLVESAVVGAKSATELAAAGFPAPEVARFTKLLAGSEWKRHQLPPVLRVSPRAFGIGRRIPIASQKPWMG